MERKQIEKRLRRLYGMSPDKVAEMHKAAGSQMWWARCWNCHRSVSMVRHELDHAHCPHCGVNLWQRG